MMVIRLVFTAYRQNMAAINFHKYPKAPKSYVRNLAGKKIGWKIVSKYWRQNMMFISMESNYKNKLNGLNATKPSHIKKNNNIGGMFVKLILADYVQHITEISVWIINSTSYPLETNFNINKLKLAIQSKHKNTAPGINGISYIMIKNLPSNALLIILNTFNDIWNNKIKIPHVWKHFRVVAILKLNKNKNEVS